MLKYNRKLFFSNLIKEAALKAGDIKVLQDIFVSKYQGHPAARGLARQYYDKFIKKSDPEVTLTEDDLPEPLPSTIEELIEKLRSVNTVRGKSRSEELSEELKLKHPDIDLTNLNEDYLSWLHKRYIKGEAKPNEIVHPIEEALITLRKFPSIQDKVKSIPEFRSKVEDAGYSSISSIKDLSLDDIEKIISLDDTELTVRIHGVEIKDEEFLGKFGEWNLWFPHTKETSVKIAGYDENYNPKTGWCTARTKDSNAFYDYIGKKNYPVFLFYIIKDDPIDEDDWLSLGYILKGDKLVPDLSGENVGKSVNKYNEGLEESDYSRILGSQWPLIRSRIESEIERHKVVEGGREIYVSPARSIIERLAKDIKEFKIELKPKSNKEKIDFIEVILDANPSEEVRDAAAKEYLRIDTCNFFKKFTNEEWIKPYINDNNLKKAAEIDPIEFLSLGGYLGYLIDFSDYPLKDYLFYIDIASKKAAKLEPFNFLYFFSEKEWAKPYILIAAPKAAELRPYDFLYRFSEAEWAQPYINDAALSAAELEPYSFLIHFSEKEWAKTYINEIITRVTDGVNELDPIEFLRHFSEKEWAEKYLDLMIKKSIDSNPYYFISILKKIPRPILMGRAKPYINTAILKIFENIDSCDSIYDFIDEFSGEEWANTKTTTPAGEMTWIEYAEKIADNFFKKSSSNIDSINTKLLKLSNILSRLNFKKEALLIKKLY